MRIDLDDAKYTAVFEEETGRLYVMRYGEKCDLCGDKFILALMQKIEESSNIAKECSEILLSIRNRIDSPQLLPDLFYSLESRFIEIRQGVNGE